MLPRGACLALLACTGACGGLEQPAGPTPLYTEHLDAQPDVPGPPRLTSLCLPQSLLDASADTPDCVLVRARFAGGSGASSDVAACRACSEPGLAPLPASIPAASVSPDLATFGCVCIVAPQPDSTCLAPLPATPPAWCYLTGPDAAKIGCPWPTAIEVASSVPIEADVFLACFPPGTAGGHQEGQ